jgi:hypothetical protein
MNIMTPLSRSQIADTCPYCEKLYAAHKLMHTLYVGQDAIVYVKCDLPTNLGLRSDVEHPWNWISLNTNININDEIIR